jgi:DNA-binding response OmpR family regulator/nitrogen-specific signal transduction histidine kinase
MYLLVQKSIQLKIQQEKAKMQHENDNLKLKFFTNISHEFRTPLTLIIGIMEKLTTTPKLNSNIQHQLDIVCNNANRMYRLTNQILELRKLQGKTIHPVYQENDIALFMNELYESFHHYAKFKNIQYLFEPGQKNYTCMFDPDKLETIVTNLLSNAFKFTPEEGTIILHWSHLKEIPDYLQLNNKELYTSSLYIKVSNTGKQIPEHDIHKIFDRFYQTELSANQYQKGTGIGLSLVKELVSIMSGNISVDSTHEGKTSFTVIIPVPAKDTASMHVKEKKEIQNTIKNEKREYPMLNKIKEFKTATDPANKNSEESPVILITEDNREVRTLIASLFNNEFKIIEAENGKEGYSKALKHLPDIIISDIMMPDEDGFEFCHNVKMNEKTNHIPFILLTARTADDYKLEGYKTGADDYIIKPFNSNILKTRVNNILLNRAMLQDYYRNHYLLDSGTEAEEKTSGKSVNDQFLQRVKEMVYENMHDENYSVAQLSENMEISRIHLNRKLNAVLGIAPSEFIKLCRLKKGMQLLKGDKKMTVSEVAYAVGFKEASYFSKSFKKHYGKSPSNI